MNAGKSYFGIKAVVTGSVTTDINVLAFDRYNSNALANQPVRVIELNNMASGRP